MSSKHQVTLPVYLHLNFSTVAEKFHETWLWDTFQCIWKGVNSQAVVETITGLQLSLSPPCFFLPRLLFCSNTHPFPQLPCALGETDPCSRNNPCWSNGGHSPLSSKISVLTCKICQGYQEEQCFGESLFPPKRLVFPFAWGFSVWTWCLELSQTFYWNLKRSQPWGWQNGEMESSWVLPTPPSWWVTLPWSCPTSELLYKVQMSSLLSPASASTCSLPCWCPVIITASCFSAIISFSHMQTMTKCLFYQQL